MSLLVARCCCLAVVLTITLYLCLRETSLAREVLPYPRGGNRKQAACTQRVQGSAIQRSKITTMAEPQQEHERPSDATEFFSQLGDMADADAIASNSQRLNTLAAWAPTVSSIVGDGWIRRHGGRYRIYQYTHSGAILYSPSVSRCRASIRSSLSALYFDVASVSVCCFDPLVFVPSRRAPLYLFGR